MNNIRWFLGAFLILAFVGAADAQFPRPRQAQATDTVAPVVNVSPPVVNVAPPAVNVSPQVSLAPPGTMDEIKSWLTTTFWGIIAMAFGKVAFAGVKTATVTPTSGGSPSVDMLLRLREKITDPDLRAGVDNTLLQVIQTGIPGMAIQSGLSLIPGVGPVASRFEPMIRNVVVDVLRQRAGAPAADADVVVPKIDEVINLINQRLPTRK